MNWFSVRYSVENKLAAYTLMSWMKTWIYILHNKQILTYFFEKLDLYFLRYEFLADFSSFLHI